MGFSSRQFGIDTWTAISNRFLLVPHWPVVFPKSSWRIYEGKEGVGLEVDTFRGYMRLGLNLERERRRDGEGCGKRNL